MMEFWPWWVGGAAVAFLATSYPFVTGWFLGVSSLYGTLVDRMLERRRTFESRADLDEFQAALLAATQEVFGDSAKGAGDPEAEASGQPAGLDVALGDLVATQRGARALFLVGIIGGGALGLWYWGRPFAPATLGSAFDLRFGGSIGLAALALFGSGVLIGFGTRMAGGCPSGHGITGIACFERGSALSTITFWFTGAAVGWAIHLVWGI